MCAKTCVCDARYNEMSDVHIYIVGIGKVRRYCSRCNASEIDGGDVTRQD